MVETAFGSTHKNTHNSRIFGFIGQGEKAVLKGDIFCANIDFSGKMTSGNIYARETLSLKAGCSAQVNLFYQRFQVELDARFAGSCKLLAEGEFDKVAAPVAALLK